MLSTTLLFQQWWQHHLTVPFLLLKKTILGMPRFCHQPSLGKVNTWMFLHLEHGRCSRNSSYLFFSIVTVATPCWGFGTQHGLIFSRFWYLAFVSTTAVTLPFCYFRRSSHYWAGHPTVWGPTVRQLAHSVYLWIPEYFLVIFYVFGLVGTSIKTNFVFRYARYAIKSDYSNLIFELCLRFFLSWQHFCNRIH